MMGFLGWLAGSGVVQGAIIGGTLAFLTTLLLLDAVARRHSRTVDGWRSFPEAGLPGTGVLVRAALQKALPAVNVFEEAAYWTAHADAARKRLTGAHAYRLHFPAGGLPPTGAFWSLTATDAVGYMVPGPEGRSSVDDHSGLVPNADGSVDILLQPDAPDGPRQNWLPTPRGRFTLMLRAYLPGPEIVDGGYAPPPIVQVT